MHVFSKNTVNTSVFSRDGSKYSISDMWSCQSVANSGVFATCAFFGVAKTLQIPMFWLDFGAPRVRKRRTLFCRHHSLVLQS